MLGSYNENSEKQNHENLSYNEFEISQSINEENFTSEKELECFRGFVRTPVVLCERLDITPYLPKSRTKHKKYAVKSTSKKAITNYSKLFQNCSVVLVRDDLHVLMKEIMKDKHVEHQAGDNNKILKCRICEKVYTNEKRLQNHNKNKHMLVYTSDNMKPQKRVSFSEQVIVHEVKAYHRCRKCPKIYKDYKSLKIHMKKEHKKRKCYICFYCNKDFVDRLFFKNHIKMHCNVCGKLFLNKILYNEHRRTVCKIIKKYSCKCCQGVFFSFLSLKDHSYDHEGVKFVCDICKEQFHTKCKLLHHIQFLHSKRRPKTLYNTTHMGSDVLYECNSCDQNSTFKNVMEEHTVSLPDLNNCLTTGYKDFYFCDQCFQQFDTETNMLKHKWTHFLKSANYHNFKKKQSQETGQIKSKEKKSNNQALLKKIYKIGEELPNIFQPRVVLNKLKIKNFLEKIESKSNLPSMNITNMVDLKGLLNAHSTSIINLVDLTNLSNKSNGSLIINKPKKTLISKHQCKECGKYLSSKYCLNRHIQSVHWHWMMRDEMNSQNLQCNICEEVFALPLLLQTHNCIRMTMPEMPFQDARPDILFDNLDEFRMGNYNTILNDVPFDIPPPNVELTEYEHMNVSGDDVNLERVKSINNMGYKVVSVQEVPIEF